MRKTFILLEKLIDFLPFFQDLQSHTKLVEGNQRVMRKKA